MDGATECSQREVAIDESAAQPAMLRVANAQATIATRTFMIVRLPPTRFGSPMTGDRQIDVLRSGITCSAVRPVGDGDETRRPTRTSSGRGYRYVASSHTLKGGTSQVGGVRSGV